MAGRERGAKKFNGGHILPYCMEISGNMSNEFSFLVC